MIVPDVDAWVIFAKVAEHGSFSRAAEDMGVASTTVSKTITRLEQRLNTTLFHRTTRKLSLTETGRICVERATRILSDGREIESEILEEARVPRGRVRMACVTGFGIETVVPVLPAFLQAQPGVEVDLILTEDEVDVVGGGFDLALRIGPARDNSLRMSRLVSFRRRLVGAPSLLERLGEPQDLDDLARLPAVIPTSVPWGAEWEFRRAEGETMFVPMSGSYRVNHAAAVVPAAVAGIGVALLPDFFVWQELAAGRLVELLPGWSATEKSAYIVTPPGRARPARVRVLMEFLRDHFAQQSWARIGQDGKE